MAKKKENIENKGICEESLETVREADTSGRGKGTEGEDSVEAGQGSAQEKFQEKLKALLALAKKKKNMLEYQEISD